MNARATSVPLGVFVAETVLTAPLVAESSSSGFTVTSVLTSPRFWNVVIGFILVLIALHSLAGRIRSRRLERRIDTHNRATRAFLRAFPDHVFTITSEGTFLSHRVPAVPGIGMPDAHVAGKRVSDVFGAESAGPVMEAVRKVLDTGDSCALAVGLDALGETRTYELRVVPFDRDQALFIARDVTERVAYEASLVSHLREKEILIREINHRVKNNLQVMSSLIALQTELFRDDDDKKLMGETQRRIHTMAYLHNLVYRSEDCSSIDLAAYVSEIAGSLTGSFGVRPEQVAVDLDLEKVPVSLATALPVGLIASELVSNSLKYAFPGLSSGTVSVGLRRDGDAVRLTVQDNGCGLPEGFSIKDAKTLGWILIQSLSRQIGGTLELMPGAGTGVTLTFPPDVPR
jgi:two-component sensor histidine kinase